MVSDLKAELQKTKEVAQVAREAAKAAEEAAYECRVEETEIRLAEKVVGVCRDYYLETWTEALNSVGVPANSELRKAGSIFFPEHIQEAPADLPPTIVLPLIPPKQAFSI